MVTFRLHLDDADERNGCLKVILASHHEGVLSQQEACEKVQREQVFLCEVKAGDMVMMMPLVLHASSKSETPGHRRVVHIEYSGESLPCRLEWV